jgi:uncharacterized membrane protein YphA (DoxX/SURF4 family)
MNSRIIGYWIATLVVAFIFVSSGICYVIGLPDVVAGVLHLGYPRYFVTLLGFWKVLGGVAVLLPGFPRLKEWAYAGMIFDLTGAAFSSTAIGNAWWHILAPLSVALVVAASWALRPRDRVLGTLRVVPAASDTEGVAWMKMPKPRPR